jgi:hypothetical protein
MERNSLTETLKLLAASVVERRNSVSRFTREGADCLLRFFASEGTYLTVEVLAVPKERPQFANLFMLEGEDPRETVAVRLSL